MDEKPLASKKPTPFYEGPDGKPNTRGEALLQFLKKHGITGKAPAKPSGKNKKK